MPASVGKSSQASNRGAATPKAEGAEKLSLTESAQVTKYLKVFREFDSSGDGQINPSELRLTMEKSGIVLSTREFRKFIAEIDTDGNEEINFMEFVNLAKMLQFPYSKYKPKGARNPRLHLAPEQFTQYANHFRSVAGDDGQINIEELNSFLAHNGMNITPERLQTIMAEVDDDGSGYLDESEFLILVIKAMGIKKRRVGPGLCSLSFLREEGWPLIEMKKIGYECKQFLEEGFSVTDLVDVFDAAEFHKSGVQLSQLLEAGWDCSNARDAGFELAELRSAGCSIAKIRSAGWDDVQSAVLLRRLGQDAGSMRLGGWGLSGLWKAEYTATELRVAGFSQASLSALQQILNRTKKHNS